VGRLVPGSLARLVTMVLEMGEPSLGSDIEAGVSGVSGGDGALLPNRLKADNLDWVTCGEASFVDLGVCGVRAHMLDD